MAQQATTDEQTAKDKRTVGLREAYSEAQATLREKYRSEFEDLYVAAAKKRGIDYKPKPTPEQKAKQELEDLLRQFPHLRDEVVAPSDEQDKQSPDEDPLA